MSVALFIIDPKSGLFLAMAEVKKVLGITRYSDQKPINSNANQMNLQHYVMWRLPFGLVVSYSYLDCGEVTRRFGAVRGYEYFRVGFPGKEVRRPTVDNLAET